MVVRERMVSGGLAAGKDASGYLPGGSNSSSQCSSAYPCSPLAHVALPWYVLPNDPSISELARNLELISRSEKFKVILTTVYFPMKFDDSPTFCNQHRIAIRSRGLWVANLS